MRDAAFLQISCVAVIRGGFNSGIVLALALDLLLTTLRYGKASGDDQANDVGTGLGKRTVPASASSWSPVYGSSQLHLLGGG